MGKTTIAKKVLKEIKGIQRTISCTTRKRRREEVNGRDYWFMTRENFTRLIKKGAFLEWARVLDNYYGTLKKDVKQIVSKGNDVLLCIDVQGAEQILKKIPDAVSIFILPPSLRILKKRLLERGDSCPEVKRRLILAKSELRMLGYYNYWIINDVLSKSIKLLKYIIYAERVKAESGKVEEVMNVICKNG